MGGRFVATFTAPCVLPMILRPECVRVSMFFLLMDIGRNLAEADWFFSLPNNDVVYLNGGFARPGWLRGIGEKVLQPQQAERAGLLRHITPKR